MIRGLFRLVVLGVVIAAAAAYLFGYRWTAGGVVRTAEEPVGTSGLDTRRARDAGAAIGATVASGASEAQRALAEAALTAKIKSKMALDDTVKAASIDVHTTGSTVTLSGTVRSEAERRRAVLLARETDGILVVTDHLKVR